MAQAIGVFPSLFPGVRDLPDCQMVVIDSGNQQIRGTIDGDGLAENVSANVHWHGVKAHPAHCRSGPPTHLEDEHLVAPGRIGDHGSKSAVPVAAIAAGDIHGIVGWVVGYTLDFGERVHIGTAEVSAPDLAAAGVHFYYEGTAVETAVRVDKSTAGDVNVAGRVERDRYGNDIVLRQPGTAGSDTPEELGPKQMAGGTDFRQVGLMSGQGAGRDGVSRCVPRVLGGPSDIEVPGSVHRGGGQVGSAVLVAAKEGVPLIGGMGRRDAGCHR